MAGIAGVGGEQMAAFPGFRRARKGLQLVTAIATGLEVFPRQDSLRFHSRNPVGYDQVSGHAFTQMTPCATQFVDGMGSNVRMGLDTYGLAWQVGPLALGMTRRAMLLPGSPTEIDGYIGDDPGMPSFVRIVERPVLLPSLIA
jgi:hypothetical protein